MAVLRCRGGGKKGRIRVWCSGLKVTARLLAKGASLMELSTSIVWRGLLVKVTVPGWPSGWRKVLLHCGREEAVDYITRLPALRYSATATRSFGGFNCRSCLIFIFLMKIQYEDCDESCYPRHYSPSRGWQVSRYMYEIVIHSKSFLTPIPEETTCALPRMVELAPTSSE